MKKTILYAAVLVFTCALIPLAHAGAETKCKACHSFTHKNKTGPGLKGIVGRKAGSAKKYKYKFTKYIKGDAWVWDEEHLRAWILDSKKAIKVFTGNPKAKTKMNAQHMKGKKADEVIAFLKSIS